MAVGNRPDSFPLPVWLNPKVGDGDVVDGPSSRKALIKLLLKHFKPPLDRPRARAIQAALIADKFEEVFVFEHCRGAFPGKIDHLGREIGVLQGIAKSLKSFAPNLRVVVAELAPRSTKTWVAR